MHIKIYQEMFHSEAGKIQFQNIPKYLLQGKDIKPDQSSVFPISRANIVNVRN